MMKEKGYVTTFWGRKRRLPDYFLPKYDFEYARTNENFGKPVPDGLKDRYYAKIVNTRGYKKAVFEQINQEGIYVIDNTSKIAKAELQCVNARIQGSAADMTKMAMRIIYENKRLKELGFRLLIQVHDELIGECPEENKEECAKLFQECMVLAAKDLPIITKTDVEIMKNWDN